MKVSRAIRPKKRAEVRKSEPPEPPRRPKVVVPPAPTIFDQDTARALREKNCYAVQYVGTNFVLSDEVRALCAPLAAEMSALFSGPLAGRVVARVVGGEGRVEELPFAAEVAEVATVVWHLVVEIARILGDRDLGSSAEGRAAAAAVVSDPGFKTPYITEAQLKSGAWVDVLADFAAPLDVPLAEQLGRVALPDGRVSAASSAVTEALGWGTALPRPTLRLKLANLERRIRESRMALQWDAGRAALAAEEQERRSQQKLRSLGLADASGKVS